MRSIEMTISMRMIIFNAYFNILRVFSCTCYRKITNMLPEHLALHKLEPVLLCFMIIILVHQKEKKKTL